MMSKMAIRCLDSVSAEEATAYLVAANGDEIEAAYQLATDRNQLDGFVVTVTRRHGGSSRSVFALSRPRPRSA